MKHIPFLLNDTKAYKKAKTHSQKKKYTAQLIQFFCGNIEKKKILKSLKQLQKDFPNAVIIGATTAGEVVHAKMHEYSGVVSLSLFEDTHLRVGYTQDIDSHGGLEVAQEIITTHTKAIITLCEGLKSNNYEAFLNGLKSVKSDIVVAGGLAGDNFKLEKTFVFLGTTIYDSGAVAVSLSAKKLFVSNRYNLNWTPIGKEFYITKASGNIVFEIENIPAAKFFEKYLGKEVIENSEVVLPNFQLLFKEGQTVVARTPMAINEDDSLVFAAPIKEGQSVQFGFSNEATVLDASSSIRDEIGQQPAEAIFIFSCIARKTLLGPVLQKEFSFFEDVAPTAGFFTYGEFYSSESTEVLLNCTTTILVLSESKKSKGVSQHKQRKKTLDSITFNALTHFIKQTSLELKKNVTLMNQYKNVVDAASLVSKTDKDGYITYVNENFCRISKYSQEELIGQNHNIVRDPNTSPLVFKKMWDVIGSGKVWHGVFSNKAKDGFIYYVDATIMPIFNEKGEIEEYIAIRQDITKQVHAKERIYEKERLIRAILDNQDSIVIHASKVDGMQSVNKKLFEYFDYKNFEDFKSKSKCICDLFLEEEGYLSTKEHPNWLDEVAEDEKNDYKVKMRTKTGAIHIFTIRIKKIGQEYIINMYDITKLEEALLKAYSSERAKSTFLANMSHEIRTPLNGILGFTDLLTKKDLDSETKRYINIIHKSGQTLLNVVNDILDFSKIESGELSLHETTTNLFEEMEAAISTFASVSKEKAINYYVYIDTNLPHLLRCDAQRLKQVMSNLISNAIKFTPEDGDVTVKIILESIHNNKAQLHFSVKDSGIGIAPEKIATIFQAFSQADSSISREFGGTGLGLAISNQYIKMMGSQIEVISKESQGSEFFFDLELDIIDESVSLRKDFDINDMQIMIMNTYEGMACGINEIVYTYLDGWNFDYEEIDEIEEITQETDILIVCAKLFDAQICEDILQSHPKLHIVYIEGAQQKGICQHERFHFIAQPMTGSSLFDRLISLVNPPFTKLKKHEPLLISEQKYDGKVLVAEDNETNQMLISIMLDERGVKYTIVENGQEALDEIARNDEYNLVFMDINMPIVDGIEATKTLRAQGYIKPIVSLSANVIESDTQSFKDAGVDDVLNKPIVPKELDLILQRYLGKQEVQHNSVIFDTIDMQLISDSLFINNIEIVKKLLKSLGVTFKDILEQLENGEFTSDLMHRLKGSAGNMRLNHLYILAGDLEKNLDKFEELEKIEAQALLMAHLQNAIEQIEKL